MNQQFPAMPFWSMWGWNQSQTADGQKGPMDPQKMWQQMQEQQRAGWEQMQNYFRSMQSFWPMPQNMKEMQTNAQQQWEAFFMQWMEMVRTWNQSMQTWFQSMPGMKTPEAGKPADPAAAGGSDGSPVQKAPAFQMPRPDAEKMQKWKPFLDLLNPMEKKDPMKLLMMLLELSYEKPVEDLLRHFRKDEKDGKDRKDGEKPGLPMNLNMKKLMDIAKILFDGSDVDYDYEE